jgi:hypothetical protein
MRYLISQINGWTRTTGEGGEAKWYIRHREFDPF